MEEYKWWQTGIIYQIYPKSFMDSNNDGIGDLPGILSKLDYIKSLGVKTVWISPIFSSPMKDFGYDVADYKAIHPIFGTMKDFDKLLDEVHKRDLKLLLDLVPSHTSDQHEWFKESKSSRYNPKRDWYIWKDPKPDGSVPNNWIAGFGGSSWEYDKASGQYYLHSFSIEQPDLNYRNPEVIDAMCDVIDFWLAKGIDGFRVDVICNMIKDGLFRDNPVNKDWNGFFEYDKYCQIYTFDQPGIHDIIKRFRAVFDKYDDRVMIGETYLPYTSMVQYYGDNDECHLPFNFHIMMAEWNAQTIKKLVDEYDEILPDNCWPNYVLGNHDQKRIVTRIGKEQARVANMMLMTLRGTPTIYNGEEIGMHNVKVPVELMMDPPALNNPEIAEELGRDPERTPMQWDCSSNAGFTADGVTPWLPIADDYKEINIENESKDPTSMLSLFYKLVSLRNSEKSLTIGNFKSIAIEGNNIFAYKRYLQGSDSFIVVMNMGDNKYTVNLNIQKTNAQIEVATDMKRTGIVDLINFELDSNEGLIFRVSI